MSKPILIDSLEQIVSAFDVVLLDQFGVLHDGSASYPSACEAMTRLHACGKEIFILSNSGKRSDLNLKRIERLGLPGETISGVVTSGEALWQDMRASRLRVASREVKSLYPICARPDDSRIWAAGGDIQIVDRIDSGCDAILLMGLPDGTVETDYDAVFQSALEFEIPLICSNPDKTSPRADRLVMSPGMLAARYQVKGGQVIYYGKPHRPVFHAVMRYRSELDASRFLMVGDSLEHDIAGGQKVGVKTALVRGGIHQPDFANLEREAEIEATLFALSRKHDIAPPDYSLRYLT